LLVTVIVPVLDDAAAVRRLLPQLLSSQDVDVIVVDGGRDASLAADSPRVRLVRSAPGRALQMNAGAAAASGTWLLFLHADSALPDGWLDHLRSLDGVAGGWFRFALDDAAWQARVIERLTNLRVRLARLPYGDQGIFVARSVFRDLGGFRGIPLMEDVEFVRRLARTGPVVEIPLAIRTSSRRWRADGWWRRSARNMGLVALYFLGVDPERLARWYSTGKRR
jgi:rSAM/selenodomain-associated transferase 2